MGKRKQHSRFRRFSKSALTVWLVVGGVAALAAVDFVQRSRTPDMPAGDMKRVKGPAAASLKIVEFADFTCSECAAGFALMQRYLAAYPNRIQIELRYFPLNHAHSMTSALWAQCAARQDKFWIMHDLLFDRQPQWQTLPDPEFFFRTLAGQSGLDTAALESCVRDPRTREVVMADKLLGESRFIRSTPTYFINGKMTVGVEALRNKLEDALGMM